MEYVNFQFNSFLILFLAGMILGGFFDFYRVFRSTIRVNQVIDNLGDLLFWLVALLLLGPLFYWSNWLELRFYVWLALGAGLLFYFTVFSPKLIKAYLKFWKALSWGPRQFVNLIQHLKLLIVKMTHNYRTRKKESREHRPPGINNL